MTHPNRPSSMPDDHDLNELFRTQRSSIPAELDQAILAAAKTAVTTPDDTAETSKRRKRTLPAFGHWLAVAATLFLGVAITPLLLRDPSNSLAPMELKRSAEQRGSIVADEEAIPLSADVMVEELSADGPTILLEQAPLAPATSPVIPALQMPHHSLADTAEESELALDREANESVSIQPSPLTREASPQTPSFRGSADSWLAHIRELLRDERTDEAFAEYEQFRQEHPQFESDFKLQKR